MKINLSGLGAVQLVMLIGWFITGCQLSLWVVFLPLLVCLGLPAICVVLFLVALVLAASGV